MHATLKAQIEQEIAGRPVTKDLLFRTIAPHVDEWNNKVSLHDTPFWTTFFGRSSIRYFFTIYANDLAYRICTIDYDSCWGKQQAKTQGYMAGVTCDLCGVGGDGYDELEEEFEVRDGVEILVYRRARTNVAES